MGQHPHFLLANNQIPIHLPKAVKVNAAGKKLLVSPMNTESRLN